MHTPREPRSHASGSSSGWLIFDGHARSGELTERDYLQRALDLLNSADAQAVLAASSEPGPFFGAVKDRLELRLKELARSPPGRSARVSCSRWASCSSASPSPPDTYGSSSPSYLSRCLGVPR